MFAIVFLKAALGFVGLFLTQGQQQCAKPRNITIYEFTPAQAPVDYPKYHPGLLPQITSQPTREPVPTVSPTTAQPTKAPTQKPTQKPTRRPTVKPTTIPTKAPTVMPTTKQPTVPPTAAPTSAPTMGGDCPLFRLDFKDLNGGDYVTNQLQQSYGVTIAASANGGGYTPGGAARVFDTAFPMCPAGSGAGDASLGSPNVACGGPGQGSGGASGSAFSNCVPLGNALVIQQSNMAQPQDNAHGGTITFTFGAAVDLESVTMLNVVSSSTAPTLTLVHANGAQSSHTCSVTGENGVTTETLMATGIVKLMVTLPGSGAISSLDYRWCPPSNNQAANAVVASTMPASKCPPFSMNFNEKGISRGAYITNDLSMNYGVTIAAYALSGGYTPNNAARIFDSSITGGNSGNVALGSPNSNCPGRKNPGQGSGGGPNSPYANCQPLGNLLVVSANGNKIPKDNPSGGSIRFKFERPAYIDSVTIVNIPTASDAPKLMSVHWDGTGSVDTCAVTGVNGVATSSVEQDLTKEFWVMFPAGGAVAQLNYRMCA